MQFYKLKLKGNQEIKHLCVLDTTYYIDTIEVCFSIYSHWLLVVCCNYSNCIKKTNHNTRHKKSAQECTLTTGKENVNTAGPPHLQVCASQFCLLQKNYSDSLCASQCKLHAYSQSYLHSNTQQATSAHVSCSEATQISSICVFENYFFDNI